ncbi:hypothetical protein PUN28_008916 [Cardiocondyla obscurior]|uniref:Uncharacterized protein n=1 Tax=Cardiocondyla obscurior TaxID=286306 RepID=A0AAW2FQZ1_9HYME
MSTATRNIYIGLFFPDCTAELQFSSTAGKNKAYNTQIRPNCRWFLTFVDFEWLIRLPRFSPNFDVFARRLFCA